MVETKICPKRKGKMRPGNYTGTAVSWKKEGDHEFLKSEGFKIITYACEKCGYMESYVRK